MQKLIYKFFKENQKGFSLIELMVVIVILTLIILGLVTFFTGGARSWIAGQNQLKAQREARQNMDMMVREIREGKEIVASSNTSVTVRIPIFDTDGFIIDYNNIEYKWVDTTIQRESSPLIDNVQTFEVTTNPGDSKLHILLRVDVDNDENPDITLNSDVNLRNYGL